MANEEHLALLRQETDDWNDWRADNPEITPNLIGADLSGAHLSGVNLYGANLSGANLSGANLNGAHLFGTDLYGADLYGASLIGAHLNGANLSRADLSRANLSRANLSRANFSGTNLSGTNLYGADIGYTSFSDIDLGEVKGLESVNHLGPSSIGVDTVYNSQGNIPEEFLRGCGLPDTLIAYVRSLTGERIQFYSCFISYSHQDEAFAQRLYNDLQGKGVRCWFAPEDMKVGDRIRPTIDQAIRVRDKLLLVLSEHSIKSQWVETEVETAFEEERRQKKTILFPISLDKTVMEAEQAWSADIRRTRHIGDFSQWKEHDAYQQALARLLRDLRGTEVD